MRDPSQTQMSSLNDDEIDLRELFGVLWRGKIVIMLCVIVAIALAAFYLRTAERKYTVRYVFAPIESDNSAPNFGGLGGFASLAGISLPSSTSSDFIKFKFLLTSEEVATQLLKNDKLTKSIFASEWDAASASFRKPLDSRRAPYIRAVKKLLTGQDASDYVAPNAARLSNWLSEAFGTSEDRETGFLTLSAETSKPELIKQVISRGNERNGSSVKRSFHCQRRTNNWLLPSAIGASAGARISRGSCQADRNRRSKTDARLQGQLFCGRASDRAICIH